MGELSESAHLQDLLDLLQAGHDSARTSLLEDSLDRFRHLARRMFHRSSDLRRFDDTDDVLQKAMIRLHRALVHVKPPDVRAFIGLAARQIRFVLRDLAREASKRAVSYRGESDIPEQEKLVDPAGEPHNLLEWSEFHHAIESLPAEEREIFDLHFYQGLPQPEAAALLQTSLRTVKRRWQSARLMLRDALRGQWPSLEGERE